MADAPITLKHKTSADNWATSDDRVVVFSVTKINPDYDENEVIPEGEDRVEPREIHTDYTMPAKPNVGFALKYLKEARQNPDSAVVWLIETAIGADGYDALADELSEADDPQAALATFNSVAQKIQTVALGGLEAPKA